MVRRLCCGCHREVLTGLQGSYIVAPGSQDTKAMQGALVRMARPVNQEDRVVEGMYIANYTPVLLDRSLW